MHIAGQQPSWAHLLLQVRPCHLSNSEQESSLSPSRPHPVAESDTRIGPTIGASPTRPASGSYYGPSCYGPSCYGPSCYGPSCYGPSCYGPSCYGPSCPCGRIRIHTRIGIGIGIGIGIDIDIGIGIGIAGMDIHSLDGSSEYHMAEQFPPCLQRGPEDRPENSSRHGHPGALRSNGETNRLGARIQSHRRAAAQFVPDRACRLPCPGSHRGMRSRCSARSSLPPEPALLCLQPPVLICGTCQLLRGAY